MATFKLQIAERNKFRYNNDKESFNSMRTFIFRAISMDGFYCAQLAELFDEVREMNEGESIYFFTSTQHIFKADNLQEAESKFNWWYEYGKKEGWDGFKPKLLDAYMIKKTAKSYIVKNIYIN